MVGHRGSNRRHSKAWVARSGVLPGEDLERRGSRTVCIPCSVSRCNVNRCNVNCCSVSWCRVSPEDRLFHESFQHAFTDVSCIAGGFPHCTVDCNSGGKRTMVDLQPATRRQRRVEGVYTDSRHRSAKVTRRRDKSHSVPAAWSMIPQARATGRVPPNTFTAHVAALATRF